MNENQVINVALTIDEIRYAAKVIRKDATQEREEVTLGKLERVIEAYDYVAKREAKRKKEAEAEAREAEAVALLSNSSLLIISTHIDGQTCFTNSLSSHEDMFSFRCRG